MFNFLALLDIRVFGRLYKDKLPGLYDTKENISDVGVISLSGHIRKYYEEVVAEDDKN